MGTPCATGCEVLQPVGCADVLQSYVFPEILLELTPACACSCFCMVRGRLRLLVCVVYPLVAACGVVYTLHVLSLMGQSQW